MTTITIKLPGRGKAKLSALVKELGGEIVSVSSEKDMKKTKLLNDIRKGLRDVKAIQDGKARSYSISDLFDDK